MIKAKVLDTEPNLSNIKASKDGMNNPPRNTKRQDTGDEPVLTTIGCFDFHHLETQVDPDMILNLNRLSGPYTLGNWPSLSPFWDCYCRCDSFHSPAFVTRTAGVGWNDVRSNNELHLELDHITIGFG
jgi:hypothetical protein